MTDVERVRSICKSKGIAISTLENNLGFGNGYLNPKKAKTISSDRLIAISNYLNVPISEIIGEKEKPAAQGDGLSTFDSAVLDFMHSLPREQLRGILLALKAPQELLDALDREERPE